MVSSAAAGVSPREGIEGRVDMAGAAGPFPDGKIAGRSCAVALLLSLLFISLSSANQRQGRPFLGCVCDSSLSGASTYGFPSTPPDLVVGIDSPEVITCRRNQVRVDAEVPPTMANAGGETDACPSLLSINAGVLGNPVDFESIEFQKDSFFVGGDTISTDAKVGEGKGLALYQTARFGNFSYTFQHLDPGDYVITLHLAEIVFTSGPPGMRIFDVFIQEEKNKFVTAYFGPSPVGAFVFLQVVSGVDIYAQVGSNQPLVLSDLRASVRGEEGLTIRFEGVMGNPLVCGLSIRNEISKGASPPPPPFFSPLRLGVSGTKHASLRNSAVSDERFDTQLPTIISSNTGENAENSQLAEDKCGVCKRLRKDYELLWDEQSKTIRDLEDARKESDLKSKECYEAWMSLQELQMELMRKSMHVGSLAVAVEGQVKERTRWFSALRELSEKFQLLKLEHVKLSSEASEYKRNLTDTALMAATIQSASQNFLQNSLLDGRFDLEKAHIELREKFIKEAKGRKELYNKVLELKGNIRVFCRCRPLNPEETSRGASTVVDFEFAKDGELSVRAPRKVFRFDSVFGPQADQEMVFENTSPLATSVLDGYNVCIFAYGQTGTGKTFTMEGTKEARGVNYRTLEQLFRIINERQGLFRYEISVSALEVYNEQIRDLLSSGSQPGAAARRLEIKQVAEGVHHVPGLVEACVSNMHQVWEVLQTGSNARAVGATNCNEHSSRSHCIHCVMVKGENVISGECTRSKLWLIDLAGSERVAKTDVQGDRLKEAQNINKSLSALGDVISALATKSPHIPFRNSKLTHLLQDSLGGDSKTLMFVQISPSENDVAETLCSLNFASRVRGIELGPAKKQFDTSEASKCKHMLEKAKQEIKGKDEQIKRMEESASCLESKMKAKDLTNKNLQERVKELEAQLLIERKLARQHVDTKIAENQLQQKQQQQQERDPYSSPNNSNRTPLSTRPLPPDNHLSDVAEVVNYYNSTAFRVDVGNSEMLLPTRNNKTLMKENKPELAEETLLFASKASRRFSISTTSNKRTSIVPAPRRDSLIPAPAIKPMEAPPFALFTIPGSNIDVSTPPAPTTAGEATSGIVPQNSQPRSGAKRFSSILRRSLQKKVIIKTPLQQHARRGGGANALEKAGPCGGAGRKARRVVVMEAADRGQQHKWKKEKERGWNHGSSGGVARNLI
ncbi:hypothetical protein Taro_020378 [Colocasia esculenta]|uniref:Kinesin motor domain-containing protein n=1 Tax=Colocasia esculenta TaxID=4460 RepID=A0A843UNI0_COLES|nr:hypothetical protein [Colocasia esculenta]